MTTKQERRDDLMSDPLRLHLSLPYCDTCKRQFNEVKVKLVKETEDTREYEIDWSCPTCGAEMVRQLLPGPDAT